MAITKEHKSEIVAKYGKNPQGHRGAGSPDCAPHGAHQRPGPHFEKFSKDHHSRVGLLKMVGKRRRLL